MRPLVLFILILSVCLTASCWADDLLSETAGYDSLTDQLQPQAIDYAHVYTQEPVSRFPEVFKDDFLHLFSRGNLYPVIGIALATGLSHNLWDSKVHHYFRDRDRLDDLAETGNFVGGPLFTAGLTGGFFAVSRFTDNQKFRSMSYALMEGFVLNAALTSAIKYSTRRLRPDLSNHKSFLSGHTSTIATISTVLTEYYGWKVGIPVGVTSAVVASARLGSNRHFLSDVVAGAGLGYLVGKTVSRHNSKPSNIMFMPSVSPSAKGAGFFFMARF